MGRPSFSDLGEWGHDSVVLACWGNQPHAPIAGVKKGWAVWRLCWRAQSTEHRATYMQGDQMAFGWLPPPPRLRVRTTTHLRSVKANLRSVRYGSSTCEEMSAALDPSELHVSRSVRGTRCSYDFPGLWAGAPCPVIFLCFVISQPASQGIGSE